MATWNARAHSVAAEDGGGSALRGEPPAVQQQHALGPRRGALEVVDHREHGHAAGADLVQDAEELQLMADVQVGGGLVEQEHPRLLGEAAGQRGELPLAGRKRGQRPVGEVGDPGAVQRVGSPRRGPPASGGETARGADSGPARRAPARSRGRARPPPA